MRATTHTSVTRALDDWWRIGVCSDAAPVFTVTPPDGVPGVIVPPAAAPWLVEVLLDQPGRWVAHVASTSGAVNFAAWVGTYVPASGMPDRAGLSLYMRDHSYTDDELDDALAAEAAAQRAVCRIPADYGPDLANALYRRAQRNLMMRGLPLALPSGDVDTGPQVIPGRDPEVRRLEAPYRRVRTG